MTPAWQFQSAVDTEMKGAWLVVHQTSTNLLWSRQAWFPRILAIIWWASSAFLIRFFNLDCLLLLMIHCNPRSRSRVIWGIKQAASVHLDIYWWSCSWCLMALVCANVLNPRDNSSWIGPGATSSASKTLSTWARCKGEKKLWVKVSSSNEVSGHFSPPFISL